MNLFSNWFVCVGVVGNQEMFNVKCFHWKTFEQIGIGMAYLRVFLITMHKIDTAVEVYLELFQTYKLELFCENS